MIKFKCENEECGLKCDFIMHTMIFELTEGELNCPFDGDCIADFKEQPNENM